MSRSQEFEVNRQLAERFFEISHSSLERARRQETFFSGFGKRLLSEYADYPRQFAFSVLRFLALLAVWGILTLVRASIDNHST